MLLRKLLDSVARFLRPALATFEDERALGLLQVFLEHRRIGIGHASMRDLDGRSELTTWALGGYDIFRQPDNDRARTALLSQTHRIRDDTAGAVWLINNEHALGNRAEPLVRVEFLERLAVAVFARNQTNEQHERDGVLPGGVDTDLGVGSTGAAGDHDHSGFTGRLTVGICHVGGAALVAAHNGGNISVVQTVKHSEVTLTGDQEDVFRPVVFEGLGDGRTDVHGSPWWGLLTPPRVPCHAGFCH